MADVVIPVYPKDPDAVLDYIWDWADWLAPGETIVTSEFIVSAGLDLQSDGSSSNTATAWLAGGTQGTSYLVTNRITTSAGRTDDRSATIRVKNR
jgi:hypothetical protein